MYTIITEVELILNSRPLTALSDNINDLSPLTLAHFLIPTTAMSLPTDSVGNHNLIHRYEIICKIIKEFWNRFSKEYLNTLQTKYKWTKSCNNIKLNQLVLLKESNLPSLKWKLGRVINVYRGPDNLVRVLKIKTESCITKRSIIQYQQILSYHLILKKKLILKTLIIMKINN